MEAPLSKKHLRQAPCALKGRGCDEGEERGDVVKNYQIIFKLLLGALNSLHSGSCILNMLLLKVSFHDVRLLLTAPEMFSYR